MELQFCEADPRVSHDVREFIDARWPYALRELYIRDTDEIRKNVIAKSVLGL